MDVVLAEYAGACYGVQRALNLAHDALDQYGSACTLGSLIHNPKVVADLSAHGMQMANSVDEAPEGLPLILRSHGVTPEERSKALARNLDVIDATCPHVARAQKAAEDLAKAGYHVIVVGEEGHPEVLGITAYARKEGARVDVVASSDSLPAALGEQVGVVVQTTQMKETLDAVVSAVEARGCEPRVMNTICFATAQRQNAAATLASRVDAMVVLGGRNSSNTTRLAEICAEVCPQTFHIESPEELTPELFVSCSHVGLTAGASTPEDQIKAVLQLLQTY